MTSTLTGVRALAAAIVRRDRIRLTLWIGGLITLMVISAAQLNDLYDTPQRLATYVATVDGNPALVMFAGPGYGFDDPTLGAVLVNETSLWMAIGCALMSVFLVNRHTRAEEESERSDLVRSSVVGRHAPLVAVLVVAVGANSVVAVGSGLGAIGLGYPVAGSAALGASFGLVGVVFASVTAVSAQIAGSSRGSLGLGAVLVGAGFVARGIGDVGAPVLAWLTPFGWGIGVRAFAGERWWTLAGLVGWAMAMGASALAISSRRDLGRGLLAPRSGPAAARWPTTPFGLTFRLQRWSVGSWAAGLFVTGLLYGSIADDIATLVGDTPELADYLARSGEADLVDAYLATTMALLAMLVCGFAVASALRARGAEQHGLADAVLATTVSRRRWLAAHVFVTSIGVVTLLFAAGAGIGLGVGWSTGAWTRVPALVGQTLALAPAVFVVVGVVLVIYGWLPRAALASWAAVAVVVIVGVFGTMLRVPAWVRRISPLESMPRMPAESFAVGPVVILGIVAVVLGAAGCFGFTRRDIGRC